MKKNSEFESILDECLERLAKGETLEQCLKSYPEQEAQLEPLLQMAQEVRRASAISPRSEFKARARYEFRSAVQAAVVKKKLPLFSLRPRWAMAAMISSILLLSGGGAALAANDSMPDSLLYPVKLATEQVQLTLTRSEIGKAEVCILLADRRVTEIIYMAGKGDARGVDVLAQRLDKHLVVLEGLVSVDGAVEMLQAPSVPAPVPAHEETVEETMNSEGASAPAPQRVGGHGGGKGDVVRNNDRAKLRIMMVQRAADNSAALYAVLEEAPESAVPGLLRAIAISRVGYGRILEALD